ncbi:MAG: AzlC family ABC transporter permease [Pelistega sp.]|nr:AzlC family ABC transporter permease [Pelistega sp.]
MHKSQLSYFIQGIRAAVPTMLGYLPASLAFGVGGSSMGLSPVELLLISFFVYAGSGQFLILASLQLGTPIVTMVFLVALINVRHLLYGPIIERYIPPGLKTRLAKAFYLTDEVFAVCYLKLKDIAPEGKTAWHFGLGIFAWLSWLTGTAIGIFAGESITRSFPLLGQTLGFSLTAMFVAVTLLTIQGPMVRALLLAALSSVIVAALGWSTVAILVGAAVACIFYTPQSQQVQHG